ncbi:MAG TPA: hypothetical protein VI452_15880 [Marmoricola sp.]
MPGGAIQGGWAQRGRQRARVATWALVVGATAGATAVAGLAAASASPPSGATKPSPHPARQHVTRDDQPSTDDGNAATPTPAHPRHRHRHHRHHRGTVLAPPTSSAPAATSSGS